MIALAKDVLPAAIGQAPGLQGAGKHWRWPASQCAAVLQVSNFSQPVRSALQSCRSASRW